MNRSTVLICVALAELGFASCVSQTTGIVPGSANSVTMRTLDGEYTRHVPKSYTGALTLYADGRFDYGYWCCVGQGKCSGTWRQLGNEVELTPANDADNSFQTDGHLVVRHVDHCDVLVPRDLLSEFESSGESWTYFQFQHH